MLSLYRDLLMVQLSGSANGIERQLINREHEAQIRAAAQRFTPAHTLNIVEACTEAQRHIAQNVTPLLSVEALLCTLL